MKKRMFRAPAALSVLVMAVSLLIAPQAQAQTSDIKPKDSYPTEIVVLVEKAHEGPLTDEEADLLIINYPELAGATPDYRPGKTETRTVQPPVVQAQATNGCSGAMGTHHSQTLLGNTFYNMHTSLDFCWEGSYVTSISNMRTHFTDIDPLANVVGEFDAVTTPGAAGFARHTYHVQNEILWGTVSNKYPYNQFTLNPGGNFIATSGE